MGLERPFCFGRRHSDQKSRLLEAKFPASLGRLPRVVRNDDGFAISGPPLCVACLGEQNVQVGQRDPGQVIGPDQRHPKAPKRERLEARHGVVTPQPARGGGSGLHGGEACFVELEAIDRAVIQLRLEVFFENDRSIAEWQGFLEKLFAVLEVSVVLGRVVDRVGAPRRTRRNSLRPTRHRCPAPVSFPVPGCGRVLA